MIEKNGNRYTPLHSSPIGQLRDKIWVGMKKRTRDVLPSQYAGLDEKTTTPFVRVIIDLEPLDDGKAYS